jgi:hypothetical protein
MAAPEEISDKGGWSSFIFCAVWEYEILAKDSVRNIIK